MPSEIPSYLSEDEFIQKAVTQLEGNERLRILIIETLGRHGFAVPENTEWAEVISCLKNHILNQLERNTDLLKRLSIELPSKGSSWEVILSTLVSLELSFFDDAIHKGRTVRSRIQEFFNPIFNVRYASQEVAEGQHCVKVNKRSIERADEQWESIVGLPRREYEEIICILER